MTTDRDPRAEADLRRELVLDAILAAGEVGISGQALAERLGCSRAAVHRHVEGLRRRGIAIDGAHEGYRLAPGSDPVSPRLVVERLTPPIAGPVRWTVATGSTNDDAVAEARAGAPEGLVIGADFQSAGRGRRGREWRSGPGDGLLFSVLLRPEVARDAIGALAIVAAVAVAEALGEEARIVWPNDIVVADRKVCGILCELAADETGINWAVVGIGINVRSVPALADTRWEPGALAGPGGAPSRMDVLVAVLRSLSGRYAEWLSEGPGAALATFATRDLLAGRDVTVTVGEREISGVAGGLDGVGRLLLATADGEFRADAGEVTRA